MREAHPLRPNSSVLEQETANNERTNRSAAVFPAQFNALAALIGGLLSAAAALLWARRPSGACLRDSAPLPHAPHHWTAPRCLAARSKSHASPRSDGRLFLLELARVAATDRWLPRGPRLWRIPRAPTQREPLAVEAATELSARRDGTADAGHRPHTPKPTAPTPSNRTHPPIARRSGC